MSQLSFIPEEPLEPGFIIDTMVMVGIGRIIYPPELKQKARTIVDDLVAKKRVISSMEVYDEIYFKRSKKDGDEVCLLADKYKDAGVFHRIGDEDQLRIADVLAQFPDFLKYDSEKPDADPWLVALAMRNEGWTIVSRDGEKDTPGMKRMKQVCRHFNIPYITDTEFYKLHGWQV